MPRSTTVAILSLAVTLPSAVGAQTAPSAIIECSQCPSSGQKPDTAAPDLSKLLIVETLEPVVFQGHRVDREIIARVLSLSPFLLEPLDERTRLIGPNGEPVAGTD